LIIGSQIARLFLIQLWTDVGCSFCLVDLHFPLVYGGCRIHH
jgi:hypothetical protein